MQHTRTPHLLQTHFFLSSSFNNSSTSLPFKEPFETFSSSARVPEQSSPPLQQTRFFRSTWVTFCSIEHQTCFTIILKTKKCNLVILWYTVPFSLILSLLSLARRFQYATHGVPPPLCRPRHVPPLSRSDRCTCPLQITNQQPTKRQTKQQTKPNNKRKQQT